MKITKKKKKKFMQKTELYTTTIHPLLDIIHEMKNKTYIPTI
jgi:hypothetical protein